MKSFTLLPFLLFVALNCAAQNQPNDCNFPNMGRVMLESRPGVRTQYRVALSTDPDQPSKRDTLFSQITTFNTLGNMTHDEMYQRAPVVPEDNVCEVCIPYYYANDYTYFSDSSTLLTIKSYREHANKQPHTAVMEYNYNSSNNLDTEVGHYNHRPIPSVNKFRYNKKGQLKAVVVPFLRSKRVWYIRNYKYNCKKRTITLTYIGHRRRIIYHYNLENQLIKTTYKDGLTTYQEQTINYENGGCIKSIEHVFKQKCGKNKKKGKQKAVTTYEFNEKGDPISSETYIDGMLTRVGYYTYDYY